MRGIHLQKNKDNRKNYQKKKKILGQRKFLEFPLLPSILPSNNFLLPILSTKNNPMNVHKKLTLATPADIQMAVASSEIPAKEIILAE